LSGYTLDIEDVEIVLGPDMGGRQIPYRKRIMPFLLFMLLTSEIIGLSNLITSEIKTGTIQALLGTPMKVIDFFAGKGITGMTMAFFQIVILMVVTNSLSRHISLVVVTLILGAMMVTGLAFIVASVSKDMMSVIAWGTLVWIIMVIPAVAVIFPGPVSVWIKVIPSYYIVDTLHRAVNFDVGWSGNVRNVLLLSGCNGAFVFFGIFALNRKLR
jgi:ABC-2 type transport system permease protein